VHANASSIAEIYRQLFSEQTKGVRVLWDVDIGNGIGKEFHSAPSSQRTLFRKAKHHGLSLFQERNEDLYAFPPDSE
jgi:hypothetical protein